MHFKILILVKCPKSYKNGILFYLHYIKQYGKTMHSSPIRFCNSSMELTSKPGDGVQNFSQLDRLGHCLSFSSYDDDDKNLQVYYNISIFLLRV